MSPSQLDRAVARITGETVVTIQRRGFSMLAPKRRASRTRRRDKNRSLTALALGPLDHLVRNEVGS